MNSTMGEDIVTTKMKPEPSELVVVDGDEYTLIDPNNRRAHICW